MKKPNADRISLRMEARWTEAENRIIQDIARRIHKNSKITSTADYQINRLKELGHSTEEIEKLRVDLERYCALDTLAVVKIIKKLYEDVK